MSLTIRPIDLPNFGRVRRYVETLEVAQARLLDGGVTHARLALIILDHLADILMYRSCESILQHEDFLAGILPPKLTKNKKRVRWEFDPKIKLLKNHEGINDSTATILSVSHKYRNPAYHRDIHNERTVRVVTQVLFECVAELLEAMVGGSGTSGFDEGSEEWQWLVDRELPTGYIDFGEIVRMSRERLLREVSVELEEVADALAADLEVRVQQALEKSKEIGWGKNDVGLAIMLRTEEFALNYDDEAASREYRGLVYKITGGREDEVDREEFAQAKAEYEQRTKEALEKFVGRLSPIGLQKIHEDASALREAEGKAGVLRQYRSLDEVLEKYEEAVAHAVWRFDYEIQGEIDLRRGK